MSRSVATHHNAVAVAYFDDPDPDLLNLEHRIIHHFPSMIRPYPPQYVGSELLQVAYNRLACVTFSQYFDLCALCLVPSPIDPDHADLAQGWCERVAPAFSRRFETLHHMATASNGEAFFTRSQTP